MCLVWNTDAGSVGGKLYCDSGHTSSVIIITVNSLPPSALVYSGSPFILTRDAATTVTPTYTGTITGCSSSPSLPAGLNVNASTCAISYTITAGNAHGNTTTSLTITINIAPPSALSYSGNPFTFTQNVVMVTQTPTFSGSVTSCTSSPTLPTGIDINNLTCAISGTPTAIQGSTSYTITASNSSGNTTATINLTVSLAGSTWTARTLPSATNWWSVTFGNGVFVAVAEFSTNAATSP